MTISFFESVKEILVLNDIFRKQTFRACFLQHLKSKIELLNESNFPDKNLEVLQRVQSQLLQPLKLHLKTVDKSSDKCLLIECLTEVVKLIYICDVSEFFDLNALVFFQIFKEENSSRQISEELKLSVLEFCSLLMKNSTPAVIEKIYSEEFCAKFSLGISVSVNIVKEDRSIKIRLAALDFLLAASKFDKKVIYNVGIYKKIGDLFASYLPGIIAPLLEVILRDETQHHLITAKAMTCWGHILCLVLCDCMQTQDKSETEIMKQWQTMVENSNYDKFSLNEVLQGKKRTQNWLNAAAVAIQPLILKISEVRRHSHPQCRFELVEIMAKILKFCKTNLKNSLTSVVEVLVSSAYDDDEKVSRVAEKTLQELEAECKEKNVKVFAAMIEENLHSLIVKLPRMIHSENEKLLLPSLKSLSGYLKILGKLNRLNNIISLSCTLRKLVCVILIGFELELYPQISNQDFSICDTEINPGYWLKPWKRFRHFIDQSIQMQLVEVCNILGKFGHCEELIDFLLDAYHKEDRFKNEMLLIINEVISSCEDIPNHVVKQLLEFYLDPTNLYPNLQVHEIAGGSLRESQKNIIKAALIMEGFGKLAKSLGKRFDDCLLSTLYYVLEKMGSSYVIIRDAATASAIEVAKACGFNGSVGLLVENNVDYLIYQLTIKMKRNDAGVFDVTTVLLKNSKLETLPHLEEIIDVVIKYSSQKVDSPHTIRYLRVIQTFVFCLHDWLKPEKQFPAAEKVKQAKESEIDWLIECLKSCEEKPKEEEEEDETEAEPPEEENILEEPKAPPLPRHIKMTIVVSNHCLHYLASKDKDKKLVVLEILDRCVLILADWENELLPLVHKIWSPLVTRFEEMTDPLIINRSFTLLCTLSHTSKQFIRSRTLKNVLPALQSFLIKESTKSKFKDSASGYFFTQSFKLQLMLLGNLGKLASSLELFEKQTDAIAECALPYLSSFQPRELQEKGKKLFEDLKSYDPYLVVFKLSFFKQNQEYAKNVCELLSSDN